MRPVKKQTAFLVVGLYRDGVRFAEELEAISAKAAEEEITANRPDLIIAGVLRRNDGKALSDIKVVR